jgi:hypothetical protein
MRIVLSGFLMASYCVPPGVKKCVIEHNGKEITISVNALHTHLDQPGDEFVDWVWCK